MRPGVLSAGARLSTPREVPLGVGADEGTMLRVGLTGGIACGKSRVLRRLVQRGCHGLDLDDVARELTAPGTVAAREIVEALGSRVVQSSGALDRGVLGSLVFSDAEARRTLEAIVHPKLRQAESRWAASRAAAPQPVLVTDGALLIEAGTHLRFDRLLVVHCEPGLQLRRLRERDGLDERAARARLDAQLPAGDKRAFAHLELDSSGTLEATDRAADAIFEELRSAAEGRRGAGPPQQLDGVLGGLAHAGTGGPRGLSPLGLLHALAAAEDLELEPLARRLSPAALGPWYLTAREAPPGGRTTDLSVVLVAWNLVRRSADAEVLVAAAASLARLTHPDAAARADACLLALLLRQAAVERVHPESYPTLAGEFAEKVRRWGGAEPSVSLNRSLAAAAACSADPTAAARLAASMGGEPSAAEVLVGTAAGADMASVAPELREALLGLARGRS